MEGLQLSAHVLQGHRLTQRKRLSNDKTHTHSDAVTACHQVLYPTQSLCLRIERIEIVAPAVAAGKEGFASILSREKTHAQTLAAGELIAQTMTVLIAQIAVAVALAFIERHTHSSLQGVFAIAQHIAPRRFLLGFRLVVDIEKVREKFELPVIKGAHHAQLAK